jgi:hypothetical protein
MLNPGVVKFLGEQKYYNGFVKEEKAGDYVRMTFFIRLINGFSRLVHALWRPCKNREPLELNDMVAGIAENILKKSRRSSNSIVIPDIGAELLKKIRVQYPESGI